MSETYTTKRVLFILTGGTIAGNVAKSAVSEHVESSEENFESVISQSIKLIKNNWNIEVEPKIESICNLDSSDIKPEQWSAIAQKIKDTYDDFDAFVVLHGTNTMGYTAAALTFSLENINKPVILTGAQVPLGYLGTDASTNIVNAIRVAVWGYQPVKGVMAVFGSKIISGTRVKKGTDFDYDPFKSFITGGLGEIGRFIRINDAALNQYTSYLSKEKPLAIQSRVLSVSNVFDTAHLAVITEFPGMSVDIFKNLVEHNGIKAFILRAFGAGDPSSHLLPAFNYLKENRIPILVTTQAPSGIASFQVNASGKLLKDQDLAMPSFDMSMESMVTKLSWLLGQNKSYEEIKFLMGKDLHGEINIENELI